jgi:hypothetical protein
MGEERGAARRAFSQSALFVISPENGPLSFMAEPIGRG